VEKKTFKNALIEMELDGRCYVVTHSEGLGNPHGQFHMNEWDMQVTFTKKAPQFPVGTKVCSKYGTAYTYTVLAQWKDTVIAVDESDDEIEHFGTDELVLL